MIRDEEFTLSRRPYAVDLSSLRVEAGDSPSAWCYVRAVWYRRKDGVLRACTGNLHGLMDPRPSGAADFIARYDHDSWGGHCEGRWDGTRYWGAQEPDVIERHLALLRPMLEGFPVIPDGYDGWWRFLTTAELRKKRGLPA